MYIYRMVFIWYEVKPYESVGILLFRPSLLLEPCFKMAPGNFIMMFNCLFSNVITSYKPRPKRTEVILMIKNIVCQQFHFPHPWLCSVHPQKICNRLNILLNDCKNYLYLDWENTVWKWVMLYMFSFNIFILKFKLSNFPLLKFL